MVNDPFAAHIAQIKFQLTYLIESELVLHGLIPLVAVVTSFELGFVEGPSIRTGERRRWSGDKKNSEDHPPRGEKAKSRSTTFRRLNHAIPQIFKRVSE